MNQNILREGSSDPLTVLQCSVVWNNFDSHKALTFDMNWKRDLLVFRTHRHKFPTETLQRCGRSLPRKVEAPAEQEQTPMHILNIVDNCFVQIVLMLKGFSPLWFIVVHCVLCTCGPNAFRSFRRSSQAL